MHLCAFCRGTNRKQNALVSLDKCILPWRKPDVRWGPDLHALMPKALASMVNLSLFFSGFIRNYFGSLLLPCYRRIKQFVVSG